MSDDRYRRMSSLELQKLLNEGDLDADAELQRRKQKKPSPKPRPVAVQADDALRERDQVTLQRMMELLVDLKAAVSSLEAKIERLIEGEDQEN